MSRSRALRVVAGAAAFAATVAFAAGCSSSKKTTAATVNTAAPVQGGIARVAEPPSTSPDAIWPFDAGNQESTVNTGQFQQLFFRPLYYWGLDDKISLDPSVSPGNLPVYSNGDKTVTVTLKNWKWSNGEPVDGQDALFWINLEEAEASLGNSGTYTPPNPSINAQYFPDDIASATASGQTFTLNLKSAVNETWFTDNELGQITPLPIAWDVTGPGTAGHCATDTLASKAAAADCNADWTYLSKQSVDLASFATNPLWQIVDGPWRLKTFNATSGAYSIVPNADYSGPQKPYLSEVDFVAYTTDTAEFADLKAGSTGADSLQVGYLPTQDLPKYNASNINAGNPLTAEGYYLDTPTYLDEISYYQINFTNPKLGPLFKQPYFDQAVQDTVDQNGIINGIDKGWGYASVGVMPSKPAGNPLSPAAAAAGGGTFSPTAAKALLTANGWNTSTTPATCATPGTGAGQCGAGIPAGAAAQFQLDYPSGQSSLDTMTADMASDAAQAGIVIKPVSKTQNIIGTEVVPCSSSSPAGCTWQAALYGGWVYEPDYYPTGEGLFATGAGSNTFGYSNAQADKDMVATTNNSDVNVMYQYEDYMLAHQPVIYQPNTFGSNEVAKNFHLDAGDPFQGAEPEYWYFTK
jgi:peptide/nickel transport system substrate-binding protein